MKLKIDIVIVNWNAGPQLNDAISSIAAHHAGLVESVIIVDNGSTDDSLALVEKGATALPFRLQIIRNNKNRGFGAACNQGAGLANSEFILFLNPDTRLFADSLRKPVNFLLCSENTDVGIVGVQLVDETGHIARSCSRFPGLGVFVAHAIGINRLPAFAEKTTHMSEWAHDSTREVDHVIGAFYFMRRTLFESLKGFDERFFVYLEDLDLSLRVHRAGYRSVFLANAQAFHAGGGTSRQVKARRLFYSLRSRLQYGFKHFTLWQAWILVFVTLCIEPVTRTVFSMFSSGWDGVANTWKAYGMLLRNLGAVVHTGRNT